MLLLPAYEHALRFRASSACLMSYFEMATPARCLILMLISAAMPQEAAHFGSFLAPEFANAEAEMPREQPGLAGRRPCIVPPRQTQPTRFEGPRLRRHAISLPRCRISGRGFAVSHRFQK